jgi:hypothetical protein
MGSLNKFLRLSRADQWLLIETTTLVSLVWLGLRLLPFQTLRRLLDKAGRKGHSGPDHPNEHAEAARISALVDKAGRNFLGKDSCFPQALTGEMMLRRRGYDPVLRIGVAKTGGVAKDGAAIDGANIKAHAWVELDGMVVIGGPQSQVDQYIPLPSFEDLNP